MNDTNDPFGRPTILRYQPAPVRTQVNAIEVEAGQVVTAVMRHWEAGETGRCRLCTACHASRDTCLILVTTAIPLEDAPLFSTVGIPRRPNAAAGPTRLRLDGRN